MKYRLEYYEGGAESAKMAEFAKFQDAANAARELFYGCSFGEIEAVHDMERVPVYTYESAGDAVAQIYIVDSALEQAYKNEIVFYAEEYDLTPEEIDEAANYMINDYRLDEALHDAVDRALGSIGTEPNEEEE